MRNLVWPTCNAKDLMHLHRGEMGKPVIHTHRCIFAGMGALSQALLLVLGLGLQQTIPVRSQPSPPLAEEPAYLPPSSISGYLMFLLDHYPITAQGHR